MTRGENSEQVIVRITPEMHAQLKANGEANERTVSQTVRYAVKRFLAERRAEAEAGR